ncbi:hypothetical protein [Geothrix sp. 21YS21S-4]|uniref:hypothetical protein n=1 Tax=Geothrix sp. 21YS21S-4 TaxID=3068889 RepID=UPI0027BA636F|nr:hypothetical protein [Geothrix sp. 21YS21S-4]
MWIFTPSSFLSIVDKGGDGSTLLIRARREGEIEAHFPEVVVETTPRNDYLYRARIDRERVAQTMAEIIRKLHHPNYKAAIKGPDLHDSCMEVWDVMYRYQNRHRKQ